MPMKTTNISSEEKITNQQIADHLAIVASRVPQVNRATAIVAGPYALVGIDIDGDLDRSRVGTIKYSVSEALQADPYGKTAIVVADADLSDRIRLMNEQIKEGHPLQGIIDELASIIGRYMPDFPAEEPPPVDDPTEKGIPNQEEQQLKDIEKEHSKEN